MMLGLVHVAQAWECLAGTDLGVRLGVVAINRLIDPCATCFCPQHHRCLIDARSHALSIGPEHVWCMRTEQGQRWW
jgi:hypothetical protein